MMPATMRPLQFLFHQLYHHNHRIPFEQFPPVYYYQQLRRHDASNDETPPVPTPPGHSLACVEIFLSPSLRKHLQTSTSLLHIHHDQDERLEASAGEDWRQAPGLLRDLLGGPSHAGWTAHLSGQGADWHDQVPPVRRHRPQDHRELPRSLHRREGLRLPGLFLPPHHPRLHAPGW